LMDFVHTEKSWQGPLEKALIVHYAWVAYALLIDRRSGPRAMLTPLRSHLNSPA
jgi:hypothetical protein